MSRASRLALVAAVVVVAVVLFVVLKPDDEPEGPKPAATTGTGTKSTGQKPSPPPIANITVKNGKPVGGIRDLEFGKGQTVEFAVTSDVSDEVHVHGYDIGKDVSPGHRVKFK